MNREAVIDEIVRQWVNKAQQDLKTAEHTLTLKDDCPYETVCFHGQQCIEKYLKAVLTRFAIDFPKTHDLTELHALLPQDVRSRIDSARLAEMNSYAIETRYPGEWEPLTRIEAESSLEVARTVRAICQNKLQPSTS